MAVGALLAALTAGAAEALGLAVLDACADFVSSALAFCWEVATAPWALAIALVSPPTPGADPLYSDVGVAGLAAGAPVELCVAVATGATAVDPELSGFV